MKEQQKQELLEMQARQEQQVADDLEAQEQRDRDPGRLMGADCESQACGACKLIVEEFGKRAVVLRGSTLLFSVLHFDLSMCLCYL